MYVPSHFKETNAERLAALIDGYPLGMLVTAPDGVAFVNHLPFMFEPSPSSKGKLLGHMARANPQWQHLLQSREALVVFQGPHAYVSPSLHLSSGVPTWNYAVVHVRGRTRLIEDETELRKLLDRLTEVHESRRPSPWKSDFSDDRRSKLLSMIVGFEIRITKIQGKFKLSQNRPLEDQTRVVTELGQSCNQTEVAVAKLMSESTNVPP